MESLLRKPRVETRGGFTVIGLSCIAPSDEDFDALWNRFAARYDEFRPIRSSSAAFGVVETDSSGDRRYTAGVEFDPFTPASVPSDAERVDVPPATYVGFETTLATVEDTKDHIYNEWLPDSDYEPADGPEFEHYEAGFDHETNSWFTIWVPIQEQ